MLKVLFLARPDLDRIKAGDTIQIRNLMSVLKKKGVKVDINLDLRPDLDGYDLVHCFNILRIENTAKQIYSIAAKEIPIVITPIYWNMEEYLRKIKPNKIKKWVEKQYLRKEVLKYADIIVPNAEIEWKLLKNDFCLNKPYRIIYNGVDECFRYHNEGPKNGIISVGRIHSRKNQLMIIKALKGIGVPVTFIGDSNDANYYKQCVLAANSTNNIRLHRAVEKKELSKIYKQSKVHILASWYDTPGLVNLEAGLAGCNIVSTNRGTAREYLKDYAYYCNPDNINQIRAKVLEAYKKPLKSELINHIHSNYTWNKVGDELLKIYIEITSNYI